LSAGLVRSTLRSELLRCDIQARRPPSYSALLPT
jgi:hypothetical protein